LGSNVKKEDKNEKRGEDEKMPRPTAVPTRRKMAPKAHKSVGRGGVATSNSNNNAQETISWGGLKGKESFSGFKKTK